MSNLTTLPKGDSAWLLRKSIQRIMQQVSVLETNIGSSTTGNSSDTQIIFNDAGTLRGDSGLTYNKTTDLLSVGSATITGDLTVDTNVFKVDATSNQVGIGTANPSYAADISIASVDGLRVKNTLATSAYLNRFHISNNTGINFIGYGASFSGGTILGLGAGSNSIFSDAAAPFGITTTVNQPLVFGINGSTAMTLNATGLGVGTASPSHTLDVRSSATTVIRSFASAGNQAYVSVAGNGGVVGTSSFDLIQDGSSNAFIYNRANAYLVFGTNNTERLRIDSSGNVGIGVTPITSHILSSAGPIGISGTNSGTRTSYISNSAACSIYYTDGGGSGFFADFGNLIIQPRTSAGRSVVIATSAAAGTPVERLIVDPNGNCGIGITPSAWNSAVPALQVKGVSGVYGAGSSEFGSVQNCFYNASSAWIYGTTAAAGRYAISSGTHQWHIAPSGTAGNAISFTQAMTLDASGNLLVGKTAASVTTIGFQTLANGEASVAMAASTSASSTLNVWSTGAAAFRFYVAMNGTISATNTTISAISDARLKENVQDIDVGLGAILALKPRKFDWKEGKGKNIKGDRGFIAQEFEQVFPNLIDEWKDPAPEGEAPYKSVRQDLIPVLVKAIQELTARVQTLETR